MRRSLSSGQPFGASEWSEATAKRLNLHQEPRPRGRPRKVTPGFPRVANHRGCRADRSGPPGWPGGRDGSEPHPRVGELPRPGPDPPGFRPEPLGIEAEPVGRRATTGDGPGPSGHRPGSSGRADLIRFSDGEPPFTRQGRIARRMKAASSPLNGPQTSSGESWLTSSRSPSLLDHRPSSSNFAACRHSPSSAYRATLS